MVLIAYFTKMEINPRYLPCFIGGKDLCLRVYLCPDFHCGGTPHHFYINYPLTGKKSRCCCSTFPSCHNIFCTGGNVLWNLETPFKGAFAIGTKTACWQDIDTIKGKAVQDFATAKTFNLKIQRNLS